MCRWEIYPVCHFYYFYLTNRLIIRTFLRISDVLKPVQILWHTNRETNKSKTIMKGIDETKIYRSTEGNDLKNSTDKNNGQTSFTKRWRSKNTWTKIQGMELEANTNFKGRCSDLEVYIFNLGPRA